MSFFFGSRTNNEAVTTYNPRFREGRDGGSTNDVGEGNDRGNLTMFARMVQSKPSPETNEIFISFLLELNDLKNLLRTVTNVSSPISARMYLNLGTFGLDIEAYASLAARDGDTPTPLPAPLGNVSTIQSTVTNGITSFATSLGVTVNDDKAKERMMAKLQVERKMFDSETGHLLGIALAIRKLSLECLVQARLFYEGKGRKKNSPLQVNLDPIDLLDPSLMFHRKSDGEQSGLLNEHAITVRTLFTAYYEVLTGTRAKRTRDDPEQIWWMVPDRFARSLKDNERNIQKWIEMFTGSKKLLLDTMINKTFYMKNRLTSTIDVDYLVEDIEKDEAAEWYRDHKLNELGNCGKYIDPADKSLPKLFQIELALGRLHLKQKPLLKEEVFA